MTAKQFSDVIVIHSCRAGIAEGLINPIGSCITQRIPKDQPGGFFGVLPQSQGGFKVRLFHYV